MRPPPLSTLFPYTTLFRSRDALGDDVVVTRGDEDVGLDFDRLWCDVVAFDDAVATGRLGEALRSEEHTSELQSHSDLVCRLLLEKKKRQHSYRDNMD